MVWKRRAVTPRVSQYPPELQHKSRPQAREQLYPDLRLLMSSITLTATSCVLWEFMLGTSPGTPQDCPPPTLVGAPGEEPCLKLLESRQECSHCQILCLTTRFY